MLKKEGQASFKISNTYIVWLKSLVGLDCDFAEEGLDLMALQGGHPFLSGIIYRYHDEAVGQESKFHRLLYQTSLSFMKAYL